ncbi:MAG: ribonuclease R [Bacteroidota bacterium]
MPVTRKQIWADVLRLFKNNGTKKYRPKMIARRLGYQDTKTFRVFRDVLHEMAEQGIVTQSRGQYQFRSQRRPMMAEGTLSVNPKGFGFVSVEDQEDDLYVGARSMGAALDGDTVRVAVHAKSRGDNRREAEVVEVLERKRTQTVGTFRQKGRRGFVESDDQRFTRDVFVAQDDFNGAKTGDKVVVSIDSFDDPKSLPEGRVLEVLGLASDPDVAVLALAMSFDVRSGFPPDVIEAAESISTQIPAKEIKRRLDLREERTFTIDPVDAKDFDDAIHVRRLDNGNVEVGVHIADVSHYVRPGTALDHEAYQRATSTYLVDRVIPMLPEKLSNGVCSLRPNEDKLTYSVIMELSMRGSLKSYRIEETVIHSHQRFTYDEAQALIDGGAHELGDDVRLANKLATTLTKRRFKNGSIDFDRPEMRVELDEKGHPTGVVKKERKLANRLIEEFMLLANQTAAKHIGKRRRKTLPLVYRVHARPDTAKIEQLAEYVKAFGYVLPHTGGMVEPADLNALLQHVKGTHEAPVIQEAALRAMAKAIYTTNNIGHFGLNFDYYSHFTSPIRRYPDLIVHRLLKGYAAGKPPYREDIEMACRHCSEQERAAEQAERESVKLKLVEYITDHIGETFEGVVSGVARFGVFVELDEMMVEGLVHVRTMDEYFEYDESAYALIGTRSGRIIRIGDPVRITVADADPVQRKVDFVFA